MTEEKHIFIIGLDKSRLSEITKYEDVDLSNDILKEDKIINIHYIQETEALVIISMMGEIFQWKPATRIIENVGSIENGILAASWSPNEERLLIASKNKTLLIFDPEFDLKNETMIDDGDQTGDANQNDISSLVFSWRGDAKFFSTNYQILNGRKSLTRDLNLAVFKSAAKADPEGGVVKSVSEKPLPNMGQALAWQPSGGIIAGFERVPLSNGKYKGLITFWEKNGLRHLEFVLPYLTESGEKPTQTDETNLDVENMQWNKESDLLGIWAKNIENGKEYILIYYRSNYKWFLKRVIEAYHNDKICGFRWSYSNGYRLFIYYQNGGFEVLDFNLDYQVSTKNSFMADDLSWVVFHDYDNFYCTPTARCIVPPPLSFLTLNIKGYANDFSVSRNHIAVLQNKNIKILKFDDSTKTFSERSIPVDNVESLANSNRPRHLLFLKTPSLTLEEKEIYGVLYFISSAKKTTILNQITLVDSENQLSVLKAKSWELSGQVVGMFPSFDYCANNISEYVLYQYHAGNIFQFEIFDNSLHSFPLYERPMPFVNMYEIEVDGVKTTIGLTQNQKLFIDDKLISSDCTSVFMYGSFLLFSTLSSGLSHLLYIYNIHEQKFKTLMNSDNPQGLLPNPEGKSHLVRCVERGSKIVSVSNDKVVLQMPRGNLEGICPRILLLHRIKSYVMTNEYKKAFELLRQQKIDLNLIFDINPEGFVQNTEEIVKQIEKVDYLNLFLTNLKDELNEDLEYILSPEEIRNNKEVLSKLTHANQISKIRLISELMIKTLTKVDYDKYILTIMTAHIKINELEIVLNQIINMKSDENEDTEIKIPPHLNPETMMKYKAPKKLSAKEILEYVCWIADADRLYEFSLGTYNLEIVVLVAQQTQKDPKEYIPYLESLKAIEDPIEMKYKINMDLKRYERAILELSKGNESQVERAITLAKQHNLYHYALKLFSNNQKLVYQLKEALGDYLMGQKSYEMAGLMFENCLKCEKAYEAFKHAGKSNKIIVTINQFNLTKEEKEKKVQDAVDYLVEKHSYSEAANVLSNFFFEDKLKDIATLYAKSHNWEELTSISMKSTEITEKIILPALKLEADIKINGLLERINEFHSKYERLHIVQENKRQMPLILGEGGQMMDSDATSDFSEISSSSKKSTSSKASGYSTSSRSSKKSKTPKNLLKRKVKEGSVLEEEWLVGVLNQLKYTESIKTEMEGFMQYLIYFGLFDPAEKILDLLEKYAEITHVKIKNIKQIDYEKDHPELAEIYPEINDFKEITNVPMPKFDKYKYLKFGREKY